VVAGAAVDTVALAVRVGVAGAYRGVRPEGRRIALVARNRIVSGVACDRIAAADDRRGDSIGDCGGLVADEQVVLGAAGDRVVLADDRFAVVVGAIGDRAELVADDRVVAAIAGQRISP